MPNLFTSGYEGESVESFFKKLKQDKVDLLVDVRQNPFSFKKGFNKSQLKVLSEQNGISYVHVGELGTPIPLRNFLKNEWNYEVFFDRYENFLDEYNDLIEDLVSLSSTRNICIVCFEKDHQHCHRKIIAQRVAELSGNILKVCHL